jgi:hypothetical protein
MQERIGIAGLIVALLAVVPSYVALTGRPSAGLVSPTTVAAVGTSTPTTQSQPVEQPTRRSTTTTSAPPTTAARPALSVVAKYNWVSEGYARVLPRQLDAEGRRLLDQPKFTAWDQLDRVLARQNGVRAASTDMMGGRFQSQIQMVVTGQRIDPVVISNIRANVLRRERPLSGTLVAAGSEGEGKNIEIGFDLDSRIPTARRLAISGNLTEPYFAKKHITIGRGEHVVFAIAAYTAECYCEWEVAIEAIVDGKTEVFRVRDSGRPFRTTARAKSYETEYEWSIDKEGFVRIPVGSTP